MDKSAIRNFSTAARKKLIDAVKQKAYEIGVLETEVKEVQQTPDGFIYNGILFDKKTADQRAQLIKAIENRSDEKGYRHGYDILMEEAAYTWFNRLIALRFMEVNDYLPSNIRILSSATPGKIEPDVIHEVDYLDYVDKNKTAELFGNDEKLYRYILIAQCNALSDIMPKMFEKLEDYTELLLPDQLYTKDGIVYDLVHEISEDDFREQVEIIGWLYQYYISEKKDDVFTALKKNVKITKENIPAATQLFTPDWIVKYMVENSLGRLFVEKLHVNPADFGWKYYLPEAEQTAEVYEQLKLLNENDGVFDIQKVKLIDPCMGSGHILVYAFDVFRQIYTHLGYSEREIPQLILSNNIYGLDIDDRAGQLAYFALMMKARSCSRQFFKNEATGAHEIHVHSIIESDAIPKEHLDVLNNADITFLYETFADAKEYGSLLKFDKEYDFDNLENYIRNFKFETTFDTYSLKETKEILLELIQISKLLTQKYDVVVTNPPYMGGKGMSKTLSDFGKKNYPDSKSDLFAMFIEKGNEMVKPNRFNSMVTMQSWMFLSSFEKMRKNILEQRMITNLMQMENGVMIGFGTSVTIIRNNQNLNYKGTYNQIKPQDITKNGSPFEFPVKSNRFVQITTEKFKKIPGMPLAYWASNKLLKIFETSRCVHDYGNPRHGMSTGNNDICLKLWHEICIFNISFGCPNESEFEKTGRKWVPYSKGGNYRKWYGNNEYVLAYDINSKEYMKSLSGFRASSTSFFFQPSINWSDVSSHFGARYSFRGFAFDGRGASLFAEKELTCYILALLCSKFTVEVLLILNPTLTFNINNVENIPMIYNENYLQNINNISRENISISKYDWDSFETSWDFQHHPLIVFNNQNNSNQTIENCYKAWETHCNEQFNQLKQNEEELNKIFIEIYGLQDELTPEVEDKDITVRKADLQRDIKSFISYAVGCMFGRYSLDVEGLAFAGGVFDESKYQTFIPDKDNIIPITDDVYFEDDIVSRFVDFVKTVYGEETLEENLKFISDALYPNGKGSSRELIRKYFVNDFFQDHVKTYQKRPIYWQFDSGKQGGFKALIYLHRYDKQTAARVRTDYLHPLQRKYEAEIKNLEMRVELDATSEKDKVAYRKEIVDLKKKIDECMVYDQVLAHIAHQAIELDLDDGVTVNYAKFQDVEVPQGDGGKVLKMNLLTKI